MRPLLSVVLVLLTAVSASLGYALYDLKHTVEDLRKTLGVAAKDEPAATDHTKAYSKRIEELEEEVEALRTKVEFLSLKTPAGPAEPNVGKVVYSDKMEKRILDVVTEEANQVIGKHLHWHRDRLVKSRQKALEQFAAVARLSETQSSDLGSLLEQEADELLNVMMDPVLRNDPQAVVAATRRLLENTDDRARSLLDEAQMAAWVHARTVEKSVLAPWLLEPDDTN